MKSDERSGRDSRAAVPRPVVPPGALRQLKKLIYEVYVAAGMPSLDRIRAWITARDDLPGAPGRDTIRRVIGDPTVPPSQVNMVAVAAVLAWEGGWDEDNLIGRVRDLWVRASTAEPVGRPLEVVTDPFGLEVHRCIGLSGDGPTLPAYVPRDHDRRLRGIVADAAAGNSRMAVLVGGSLTGKTRACWEALTLLRDESQPWRLWHPIYPTRADAALADLVDLGPRTVVWLNEAQLYLADPVSGRELSAGLREAFRDGSRAPILVLATLWPHQWDALIARDDSGGEARDLLLGHSIPVPDSFTDTDLDALASSGDPRLAEAASHAPDGQITQYLGGGPFLLDRYHQAPPATRALIHAAMDSRRLGCGPHLPLALLADAAPGYLTETQWEQTGEDWLARALDHTAIPSDGLPSILVPISNTTRRNRRKSRAGAASEPATAAVYRLADYLEQHGIRARAGEIPPVDFWVSCVSHASPVEQRALGKAAWDRGLYRDATQFCKNAVASGDLSTVSSLLFNYYDSQGTVSPADAWAAANVPLDDTAAVADLMSWWVSAGFDREQFTRLARRAVEECSLEDPKAVTEMLRALWKAGPEETVSALFASDRAPDGVNISDIDPGDGITVLLTRGIAEFVNLDSPRDVSDLLFELIGIRGAQEQIEILLGRVTETLPRYSDSHELGTLLIRMCIAGGVEHVLGWMADGRNADVLDPNEATRLLQKVAEAGHDEMAAAWAAHVAAGTKLIASVHIAKLINALHARYPDALAVLLARKPAEQVSTDDLDGVAKLLDGLREAGAVDQVRILADRVAATISNHEGRDPLPLLESLERAGAEEQMTPVLAHLAACSDLRLLSSERWAARQAPLMSEYFPLGNSAHLRRLVRSLDHRGERECIGVLADRGLVAEVSLTHTQGVTDLIGELVNAGYQEPAAQLTARLVAETVIDNPGTVAAVLRHLWESGASGPIASLLARDPASHTALDDLYKVSSLLDVLVEVEAEDQVAELIARIAADAPPLSPGAVAHLIDRLRSLGVIEEAKTLALRSSKLAPLGDPVETAALISCLRESGEPIAPLLERDPASAVEMRHPDSFHPLLHKLRAAGADEQLRSLAARIAESIPLDYPKGLDRLLDTLQSLGAGEAATKLVDRLPAAGLFSFYRYRVGGQARFRFGREPDGCPATPWNWDDLD